jgi:hypothetical protein
VGAERLGEQQVEVAVGEAVGGVSREKDCPLKRVNLVAQLAGGGGELGGDAFAKFLEGAAGFLDAFEVGPDDLEEGVPVEFVAGVEGGADVGEGLAAGEEGGGGGRSWRAWARLCRQALSCSVRWRSLRTKRR